MPATRLKASSLSPLEQLDGFIREQKARREEFWARHRQSAALQTTLQNLQKEPSSQKALTPQEGKKECTRHWNPPNCVEIEVHARKAVVARQVAVQKLAQCCAKVDEHVQLRRGFILSQDPVIQLFFALVERARERTIDAVECVASWERIVGRGQPFLYKNKPYLPELGEDLKCLDGYAFVRSQFRKNPEGVVQESCADDPFLCSLTPSGIPIEPVSSFAVRQGGRLDQRGLRLRSAFLIVEPRITSASLLTRLNPAPGQLPTLRARGRSTTRKTTLGPQQRAASPPLQRTGPEQGHLPSIMGGRQPSGPAKADPLGAVSFVASEHPPVSSKHTSGAVIFKHHRSVCSAPPRPGSGNTPGDTSSIPTATVADATRNQQDSVQSQAATPQLDQQSSRSNQNNMAGKRLDPVTTGNTVLPCTLAHPVSRAIIIHNDALEDAGVEHERHVPAVSQAGHVQREECNALHGKERGRVPHSCSQDSIPKPPQLLTAALSVRPRVRVSCTPQPVVQLHLSTTTCNQTLTHPQAQSQQPVSLSLIATARYQPATHPLRDESKILAHKSAALSLDGSGMAAHLTYKSGIDSGDTTLLALCTGPPEHHKPPVRTTADTATAKDSVAVDVRVCSDSGEVCTTIHVVSSCDSPQIDKFMADKIQEENCSAGAASREVAPEQSVIGPLRSIDAKEWLEAKFCVNDIADVTAQGLDESIEKVTSTLQTGEFCVVTFQVVEEVLLVLRAPLHEDLVAAEAPQDQQLFSESKPEALSSAGARVSDYDTSDSILGVTSCLAEMFVKATGTVSNSGSKCVTHEHDTEESLALGGASDDLRCNLSTCGLEAPVDPIEVSSLKASGNVSDIQAATCQSASNGAQAELLPSTSPVKSLEKGTAVACTKFSKSEVLVSLVVQVGSERVAVDFTTDSDVGPTAVGHQAVEQPCMHEKGHVPSKKLPQDLAEVIVTLHVRQDGLVCISMHSSKE